MIEVGTFGWGHFSRGTKLCDLLLREVTGRTAHGVERLEDISVLVVHTPDFYCRAGRNVLEFEVKGLRRTCGTCGHGIGRAGSGRWSVVPESDGETARCGFGNERRVGFGGDAAVAEFVEDAKDIQRGFGYVVGGDQAEAAVEWRAHDTLFFENVGEGPVRHALGQAVAEANVVGEPRTHEGRVGDVGLIRVAGVVLGEDQRDGGIGRVRNLVVDLLDRAPDHRISGNIFVGAEDIIRGVIGVHMGRDEDDGNIRRLCVSEERRYPGRLRSGWAPDLQALRDPFDRACGVIVKFEICWLLRVALPEVNVGLVPYFELPCSDFIDAVTLDQVPGQG